MLFYKNTQSSHCACADEIMNYPMKTPYFLEKMYNKMKEQIVFYKNSLIGTCTLLPALCPALHCACAVKITNYSLKKLFLLERIYYKMKENIFVYRNSLTETCTLLPELYPALHCACAVKSQELFHENGIFAWEDILQKWKRTCRSIGIHNLHTAHTQMKSWITQWKRHIFLRRCITKWKNKSFSTSIALSELVPYYRHFAPLYTAHAQLKSRITRWKNYFCLRGYITKWKRNILVYRNSLTETCTLLPELYPALHCACAVEIKNYSLKTAFLLEKIYYKMKKNMLFYKNTQSSHCACADKIMNYPMKTPYFL